jgi:hypothetical protein
MISFSFLFNLSFKFIQLLKLFTTDKSNGSTLNVWKYIVVVPSKENTY